jgi:hypothetical protein
MIPGESEEALVAAFAGTAHAEYAANRDTLLRALSDLDDKGWMRLIKVMGPWSWQVTSSGMERAAQLRKEDERSGQNKEKELRHCILQAFDAKWRSNPGLKHSIPLDVAAFCQENGVDGKTYVAQASRLLEQGFLELHSIDQATLSNGHADITEAGRRQLDAPPPGAAPTREVADLYREIAHLRRQVEILSTNPEGLIRDQQLRERVSHLLANDNQLDTAVREAFVVLEERIRARGEHGPLVVGVDLMLAAFGKGTGSLILSAQDPEQDGAHLTFRGLTMWVRNAFGHRVIDATTPGDAIRIIAFIDYLLEEVGRARRRR